MGMKRTLAAAFVLTLALLFSSVAVVAADHEANDNDCDVDHDAADEVGDHEDACGDGDHDDDEGANDDDEVGDVDEGDDDQADDDADDQAGDGDQAVSPSIVLSLSATSIEEGSSVVASWTVTGFTLDAAAMGSAPVAGRGHVHLLVDGTLAGMTAGTSLPLEGVGTGSHTVRVELHNNDHTAVSPSVFDDASLDVTARQVGPATSSAGADATFLFLGLGLLIAIVSAIGAVLWQRRRKRMGP